MYFSISRNGFMFLSWNWNCYKFTAGGWTRGFDFNISAAGGDFLFWPSPWGQLLNQINSIVAFNTVCTAHFTILWREICD